MKTSPLRNRREYLLAEAAQQRSALAQHIEPWRVPLALADEGISVLRTLRRHPVLVVGGIALLAWLRPGRGWAWLQGGWATWQVLQRLRGQ